MLVEWTPISEELVLVATEVRTWVHRPGSCPGADPFATPMTGCGSPATTRRLLDAAVSLPQREALSRVPAGPLTREGYVERLVGHYYTTHWTEWQLRRAASRFADAGRAELARLAETAARQSRGRDLLAMRDLVALGYPTEYASRAPMGSRTAALLHYALRCLAGPHPVAVFGYGYALERSARAVTEEYLHAVAALLPAGVDATRCLRAHSALGTGTERGERMAEAIAFFPAEDRCRVVRAAYETARLMFSAEEAPASVSRPAVRRRTVVAPPLRVPVTASAPGHLRLAG